MYEILIVLEDWEGGVASLNFGGSHVLYDQKPLFFLWKNKQNSKIHFKDVGVMENAPSPIFGERVYKSYNRSLDQCGYSSD